MKPENWEELSYDEQKAIAQGLFNSVEGQYLMYKGLMTAAHYLRRDGQASEADDMEMIAELVFAFDQARRSAK